MSTENKEEQNEVLENLQKANKELQEKEARIKTLEDEKKNLEIKNADLNRETVERKEVPTNIKIGREDLNSQFKNFLITEVKTGVSVPMPIQYAPGIVPGTGSWGVLNFCNKVGTLDSTTLYIARHEVDPTAYWMGTTGGGTATSVSATIVTVNSDELVVKLPIYDNQIKMGSFNALDYCKREASRVMPKYEDIQVFAGSGAPFTGIYNDTNALTVSQNAAGSITGCTIADLRNMVAKIAPQYRGPNLKWYVDQSEEQILYGVCDTYNRVVDLQTGAIKVLGFEVVPVCSGVLNGATTTTTASKHFVLANLMDAIDYADSGSFNVEGIRTEHGCTNYYFYRELAIGVAQPNAACVFKLHA